MDLPIGFLLGREGGVFISYPDGSLDVGPPEGDMTLGEAFFFSQGNLQRGRTAKEGCLAALPAAGEVNPSF